MTNEQWMEQAKKHQAVLRSLVEDFHPGSRAMRNGVLVPKAGIPKMPITAPNAESAARAVREKISEEFKEQDTAGLTPALLFDRAMEAGDIGAIMSLLDQAWFGVPESTEAWNVVGFKEAVDLLDDPPDPPEDHEIGELTDDNATIVKGGPNG